MVAYQYLDLHHRGNYTQPKPTKVVLFFKLDSEIMRCYETHGELADLLFSTRPLNEVLYDRMYVRKALIRFSQHKNHKYDKTRQS